MTFCLVDAVDPESMLIPLSSTSEAGRHKLTKRRCSRSTQDGCSTAWDPLKLLIVKTKVPALTDGFPWQLSCFIKQLHMPRVGRIMVSPLMKLVGRKYLLFLSPGMVGVLFVCHILGTLCLMVPPSVMAGPTIQAPHVEHVMPGDRRCSDLVTPSTERMSSGVVLAFDSTVIPPVVVSQGSIPCADLICSPPKTGVPLYTLLCTFRI